MKMVEGDYKCLTRRKGWEEKQRKEGSINEGGKAIERKRKRRFKKDGSREKSRKDRKENDSGK